MGMTANAIEHYVTLTRSPLLLAPVIESFFHEIRPSEKNILLGYLVLPMVLYPPSRDFLKNARKTSSMRTLCSERNRLVGLPQRVNELRSTSSLAIQNSIDCGRLILHPDLMLEYGEHMVNLNHRMQVETKAARQLASLFEPYDVATVYRLLGVTNL
jgi:Family of unknown function (DUF6521)